MRDKGPEIALPNMANALRSTWSHASSAPIPAIRAVSGTSMVVSTSVSQVEINPFDESVLHVLVTYLFIPLWLVRQWYSTPMQTHGSEDADARVRGWVQVGLVGLEPDVTGTYLRPTKTLLEMFQMPKTKWVPIPFNTLRHTICVEHLAWMIMNGIGPLQAVEKPLPRMGDLGFTGPLSGADVLGEPDFRNPNLTRSYQNLLEGERAIEAGARAGLSITEEFKDFSRFAIVQQVAQTGVVAKDFKLHLPDLVVPIPREGGKPRSVAVELELSNKRVNYQESIKRYRDCIKYGSVHWYCATAQIAVAIRDAWKAVGGSGSVRMHVFEFAIPTPPLGFDPVKMEGYHA